MHSSNQLARDYLLRAVSILEGDDDRTEEIRYIISRTVTLLEDQHTPLSVRGSNVVEMSDYSYLRCPKAQPA